MNPATAVVLAASVRKERLWVDLALGPILRYCPACRHLSATPYPYSGSRYGQVGSFTCERCRVEIALTDRDCRPPIRYSAPARADSPGYHTGVTIWHEDLYGLAPQDFLRIQEWTGLRFFEGVSSAGLPFHQIMERLET